MVLPLLTEAVREPGKPAKAHTKGQIGPFHNRSVNAFGVRLTHDWDYLHRTYFGGAVAPFAFAGGTIDLDELGEVATITKRVSDRGSVRLETVRGDLEASPREPDQFTLLVGASKRSNNEWKPREARDSAVDWMKFLRANTESINIIEITD